MASRFKFHNPIDSDSESAPRKVEIVDTNEPQVNKQLSPDEEQE